MSDIFCVTNRKLCREDFLKRIEKIAKAKPYGIILREKDLNEIDYGILFARVNEICSHYSVNLYAHGNINFAKREKCARIHLPLNALLRVSDGDKKSFDVLGASCHGTDEAKKAEAHGSSYITAGHIFETQCKKGLAPRGLEFLKEVCKSVQIPVFAIGGITPQNYGSVKEAGAFGACLMSSLMQCEDPESYMNEFKY